MTAEEQQANEEVVQLHPQYDGRKGRKFNNALDNYHTGGRGGNEFRTGGLNSKLDDALFNSVDADHFISHEKAWHRRAVDMAIQGFKVAEIAKHLGYSRGQVGTVLSQPWAQQRMIEKSTKSVQDEMREFLEAEVMPSLRLVKELRDDTKLKAEVRSRQAEILLERFLGKPTQPITTNAKEVSQMSPSELAAEAQRIVERERRENHSGVPETPEDSQ
jgi:hypothetical protein